MQAAASKAKSEPREGVRFAGRLTRAALGAPRRRTLPRGRTLVRERLDISDADLSRNENNRGQEYGRQEPNREHRGGDLEPAPCPKQAKQDRAGQASQARGRRQ